MQELGKWTGGIRFFLKNKAYMAFLSLTAVLSYGFLVTHQTVGIDDTPYAYYFEEGLNAIVGRWFLYLANKVFHVSDFSPFMTDLAGVLILMAAAVVWCCLLRCVCGDKVPFWGYMFFGCIFISSPLISEVYTYYLHNGVSVGYLCTGISLCFFQELKGLLGRGGSQAAGSRRQSGSGKQDPGGRRRLLLAGLGSAVFLWIALGCYESFMIVWLLGVVLMLLTERYMGESPRILLSLVWAAGVAVAAILLRSVMIPAVIAAFGLGGMRDEAVQRSVTEMLSWMFEEGAAAEFAMIVKRFYVMYGVFAYAYYPIRIFVYSAVFMLFFSVWRGIRQRSAWIPALTAGSFGVCFLLAVIEGKATFYRSAQFLPVMCGYGAFLFVYAVQGLRGAGCPRVREGVPAGGEDAPNEKESLPVRPGAVRGAFARAAGGAAFLALCAVLWNQCFDMNRWFYVDWMKYEAAKDTVGRIAQELERGFDTSKPVVFTGQYEVPREIIADAYVPYGTEVFFKLKRWTDPIDGHLLEKFYRGYGIWVAQTPALSVIEWGRNAFGDDSELVRFFAMHGYEIKPCLEPERYAGLEVYSLELPGFPEAGSIVDVGDCIVVHF